MTLGTQAETGEGQLPSLFHLLKKHNLYPIKSLGQVFLSEPKVMASIVTLLQPEPADVIIEIGAGPGLITKLLAEKAGRVIAIEIDSKFKPLHDELFSGLSKQPQMIYGDARKIHYQELTGRPPGRLIIFGNLPYHLTTDLILTVLSGLPGMSTGLFMVEEEVSERMLARPATKKYGTLSMASQLFGQWRMERTVSRTCFFPRPNVTSALMTLTPSDDEENKRIASDPIFHRFLIGLMQYRRKTLANALKQSGVRREDLPSLLEVFLREQGLIAEVRAEQLTPSQLRILYHLIYLSEKA